MMDLLRTTARGKRSRNFTDHENSLLLRLIGHRANVVELKKGDRWSKARKDQSWHEIHAAFSVQGGGRDRTEGHLRGAWKRMKEAAKRERREMCRSLNEMTRESQLVWSILPKEQYDLGFQSHVLAKDPPEELFAIKSSPHASPVHSRMEDLQEFDLEANQNYEELKNERETFVLRVIDSQPPINGIQPITGPPSPDRGTLQLPVSSSHSLESPVSLPVPVPASFPTPAPMSVPPEVSAALPEQQLAKWSSLPTRDSCAPAEPKLRRRRPRLGPFHRELLALAKAEHRFKRAEHNLRMQNLELEREILLRKLDGR